MLDRVRFWSAYVEPRYRIGHPSRKSQPFLGGRTSLLNEPGPLGGWGFAVGAVGGFDYRLSGTLGLAAHGLVDFLHADRWRDDRNALRAGVRGALRVHF